MNQLIFPWLLSRAALIGLGIVVGLPGCSSEHSGELLAGYEGALSNGGWRHWTESVAQAAVVRWPRQ